MARQDELDKLRAKLGIGASREPHIEEHPTPVGSPPPSDAAMAEGEETAGLPSAFGPEGVAR